MEKDHYIEMDVTGGLVSGEVTIDWEIEDNSFSHAFGTEILEDVICEDDDCVDIDNLLFFPEEDGDRDGVKLTEEQESFVLKNLFSQIETPDLNDLKREMDERHDSRI
jgi:hypothetical protein